MSETRTTYEPYTPGRPGPEERSVNACRRPYAGAPPCLVTASIICVAIWAMSGGGYFWPMWVLLPTVLPVALVALGRRR